MRGATAYSATRRGFEGLRAAGTAVRRDDKHLAVGVAMKSWDHQRQWEEYQKKKSEAEAIKGVAPPRHLWSLIVAGTSFVISMLSFYSSSIQRVDDLSVVLNYNGDIESDVGISHLFGGEAAYIGSDFVFVNGGNVYVSVLNVSMKVIPLDGEEVVCSRNGYEGDKEVSGLKWEPIVIKPGEMITKRWMRAQPSMPTVSDNGFISLPVKGKDLTTCIEIEFTTPDGGWQSKSFMAGSIKSTPRARPLAALARSPRFPRSVIHRTRTRMNWLNWTIDHWVGVDE